MGGNCGVWLRKGIRQTTITNEYGDEEAMWMADEVIFGTVDGTPEPAWLERNFNALWERFAEGAMTDRELIGHRADELDGALLEVTEMLSDNTEGIDDNTGAILELSEMVAELYEMVGGE